MVLFFVGWCVFFDKFCFFCFMEYEDYYVYCRYIVVNKDDGESVKGLLVIDVFVEMLVNNGIKESVGDVRKFIDGEKDSVVFE